MKDKGFKFENFPEEIQIYILSLLPPKQLSRCKRVSKYWNTTLTIQAFLFRHNLSYDKHSKLVFVAHRMIDGSSSVLSFELSDNNTPKTTKMSVIIKNSRRTDEVSTEEVIIGNHECFSNSLRYHGDSLMSNICNDLICFFDSYSPCFRIFNLKTQDFIQLHVPTINRNSAPWIRYWYALGFDPVSKVYKILSIYGGIRECHTTAALFTLGLSNHWKPIEYDVVRPTVTMSGNYWRLKNMFCLDGVIYRVDNNELLGDIVLTVVAFDLNREVFRDYKLVLIPIQDAETIRYYLTSLKGNPTLFIWKMGSDEIQQLTFFDHKNPKAAWKRRIFTAHDFPKNFPYGRWGDYVAGGSILLHQVRPFKNSAETQEQDNSRLSWCRWYDLENFAID
ncbi:putative F-box protein At1g53550 [Silene latifolia]|uniref:putative F-box protein At1g53550 n=1 Tax=Silene latifolia TaxID=37657 RepID=UPI003D7765E4